MTRWLLALLLLAPATLQAQTTIRVCASGCEYVNANLQAALYAAVSGDTVLLESGFMYAGTTILPQKAGTAYATIRTGVTSTGTVMATSSFPAANVRLTAADSGNLAKFQPTTNNLPGIRTVFPAGTGAGTGCTVAPCVASYWKVQWVEVLTGTYGGSALVDLGSNGTSGAMPSGDMQDTAAEEPHHIILDQVYIHGDPVIGQFRGVMVAAKDVQILNSTITNIKSLAEGQAIWGDNSIGNLTITNNDIQGNGENVMLGGDTPRMAVTTTVLASPAPTTTTFTMAATAADFLTVGQGLSVVVAGVKKYTHVTAIAGAALTVEALSAAPDVPGAINYSVVPKNLTFTKNSLSKPVAWRDPWLTTPVVTPTCSITGGSLAAGTYYYRVTALLTTASANVATSTASVETSCAVATGTTGSVGLSWPAVTDATSYRVYGRATGAENIYFTVTAPTVTFTDTGAAGTGGAVPTGTGSTPLVKNVFEIKKWHTATIDGNVFDYSWQDGQTGFAILFTVLNNSSAVDGNDSAVVRGITFSNNKIRHAAAAMQITGRAADGDISDRTQDITVSNNIFEDIGTAWGAKENTIFIGTGVNVGTTTDRGPLNVAFNHNTFLNLQSKMFLLFDLYKSSTQYTADNFDFTNNLVMRDLTATTGLRNVNAGGTGTEGNTSWLEVAGTGSSWLANVTTSGGSVAACSAYPGAPSATWCPSRATFEGIFVDYAGGNFRLTGSSAFDSAGSDGLDVGANIDTIEALTTIALSGNNAVSGGGNARGKGKMRTRVKHPAALF